ncbi:ABC-2 type transporter-domain-containing protein [Geranomyces variabilis]|nr:ABC-2 type transporter-domain-containing protein [Geranomyces variabilis]KAJ3133978.1 hypothetical protein HDU90_005326 [Geranomyces variabilis]
MATFASVDDKPSGAVSDFPPDSTVQLDSSPNENARLTTLARTMSRMSGMSGRSGMDNPILNEKNRDILDPASPMFNARAWAKSVLRMHAKDPQKNPTRKAGFSYKNLSAYGFGSDLDVQKTVNVFWDIVGLAKNLLGAKQRKIQILQSFDGLVRSGEMLVVLGPPGSGCTSLLKTIAGETFGFYVDPASEINYEGISAKQMGTDFRGEATYTAETDVHFPQLTVGQTLSFAARARSPRNLPDGVDRTMYIEHIRDVVMTVFGISHTLNTRVGNDFVRGVSGGERKRVSIAEAALSGAPLSCWDNSTRGLDAANALEFCKTLRLSTNMFQSTACVAIYQAPQSAYDLFDKVAVLYEGRQIYFGKTSEARAFWEEVGFECPERQTTADFLTSLTSPTERIAKPGFESRVPRTPDEFVTVWKRSDSYKTLMAEIDDYNAAHPFDGEHLDKFVESRRAQQSKHQSVKSPYTLSYVGQIKLCLSRSFWRLKGDPTITISSLVGNTIMAVVVGSVFFNLPNNTESFFGRGSLLFFGILLSAFASALEILTLYAQRPIVEKHERYAFYKPSAEAIASMIADLPAKALNAVFFNVVIYFMTNLRREAGAFFFFVFTAFTLTMTMSMFFRTIAASSRSLAQALAPSGLLILALIVYTGYTIPTRDMLGWSRWINYINPIAYGFESLMINEFDGRNYACPTSSQVPSSLMPAYATVDALNRVCPAVGAVAGQDFVSGTTFIAVAYQYYPSHKFRNIGILFAMMAVMCSTYLLASDNIKAKRSKGEVLLFRRGHLPKDTVVHAAPPNDPEAGAIPMRPVRDAGAEDIGEVPKGLQQQTAIFHWENVCYDITIKGEDRRILDNVAGWVKPGTLTALMGVSGAGKTTLLDCLATRVTMGVVSGEMLVDGKPRDASFQRKTGYVQQQDLHLETTTVREALNFSALMRQPAHTPRAEKLAYVDEVITLLDMQDYADAVVGVPGEGLNVEQRKRLTIGVELAAKPQLLLFLDEPSSGLDSQSSWSIVTLLEKLAKSGQAILCTIHQPSAVLFQRFQRLLFLQRGGRTIYFGEVGQSSRILIDYFQRNGASPIPDGANPAEWMLEVIGAAPGSSTEIDWHSAWLNSPENGKVKQELSNMKRDLPAQSRERTASTAALDQSSYHEFAAPLREQVYENTKRVFQQYWRSPTYIYSKVLLCAGSALFIGFSFYKAGTSIQGLTNQLFSLFMLISLFGQISQQIMPAFVTQRALYEARERPSKAYSWKAFMIANVIVELPWNTLMSVFIFFAWYYPLGLEQNTLKYGQTAERGLLSFLFVNAFMLMASTFTSMMIAGIETAEAAGNLGNLAFSLCLIFCGVLVPKASMPKFWLFVYYLSPFTYLVEGMLGTALGNTNVVCSDIEYLNLQPPAGQTCGQYMQDYISVAGGYLREPDATSDCSFCRVSDTNVFLASFDIYYAHRWRDLGILYLYTVFNAAVACWIYWKARVPKNPPSTKTKKEN